MRTIVTVAALLCTLGGPGAVAGADLHAFWDQRCQSCHDHAADFARRTLSVENGKVLGRHHRDDLARFLRNHGLAGGQVEPMLAMLAAQIETTPVFAPKCGGCHGTAADFARRSLESRDGVLTGRANGKPVAAFLKSHGGLAADQIAPLVQTLTRVLGEVEPAPR